MTILAHSSPLPAAVSVPWPADHVAVLRNRPVLLGTDTAGLSRFGDDIWHIRPAHPDPHTKVGNISFLPFPEPLRCQFRAVLLAALDHPQPVEPSGRQSAASLIGIGSLPVLAADLQLFACWMSERSLSRIADVTEQDLAEYLSHVLRLAKSPARKADAVCAVRTLWLFRDLVPEPCRLNTEYPWKGLTANALVGLRAAKGESKRPRIQDETMEPLLAWALLMVEQIGPDICAAWREYTELRLGEHPSQAAYSGPVGDRLITYLDHCRRTGTPLPGLPGSSPHQVNYNHVQRLVGLPCEGGLSTAQQRLISGQQLPVASDSFVGTITGRIQGRPWRDTPLAVHELPRLCRLLSGSLFIVVCYLSGMRPGEKGAELRLMQHPTGQATRVSAGGRGCLHGRQTRGNGSASDSCA